MPDGLDLGEIAFDGRADGLEAVLGDRVGLQGGCGAEGFEGGVRLLIGLAAA
jgi:hypothetical protein